MKKHILTALASIAILVGIAWATNGPVPSLGLYWLDNTDPTVGGGMAAPLNQLLIRTDAPSIYYKSSTLNTGWTQVGISTAGGAGTVQSVSCGTGISCTPNPITTSGSVVLNMAPTTCSAGQAEVATTSTGTSTCAAFGNVTSSTLTSGTIPIATGAGALGNSFITDATGTYSVTGRNFNVVSPSLLKANGIQVVSAVGAGISKTADTVTLNIIPTTCPAGTAEVSTDSVGGSTCATFVQETRAVNTGTGLSGGGNLTANRTIILADTAVTPATYTNATVTVDQQGRVTSASNGTSTGNVISRQQLAITGTYTPTTGTTKVLLEMTGGGGGGGGSGCGATPSCQSAGGGGSSGMYVRQWIDPGGSITGGAYVVGGGGNAGSTGGSVGGPGGDSSIVIQGVTYLSKGGTGGNPGGSDTTPDNTYAVTIASGSTVCDVNVAGPGFSGFSGAGMLSGGNGGSNPLGGGGGGASGAATGGAGTGWGGGGQGGQATSASGGKAGGAGAIGTIIITEYQ